mmetsp:Transcript_9588/g.10734  ORF Transcript_9588/g.10734 Transcript_9588/m.10734 type:complete len:131 (+) Transcript_9588:212-604(+)
MKNDNDYEYDRYCKLKEVYEIHIKDLGDTIKDIKEERLQILYQNHQASQMELTRQLEKQLADVDDQMKKLVRVNDAYKKEYNSAEKEFRQLKSTNETLLGFKTIKENDDFVLDTSKMILEHDEIARNCII